MSYCVDIGLLAKALLSHKINHTEITKSPIYYDCYKCLFSLTSVKPFYLDTLFDLCSIVHRTAVACYIQNVESNSRQLQEVSNMVNNICITWSRSLNFQLCGTLRTHLYCWKVKMMSQFSPFETPGIEPWLFRVIKTWRKYVRYAFLRRLN
jgi:hypothetical protein